METSTININSLDNCSTKTINLKDELLINLLENQIAILNYLYKRYPELNINDRAYKSALLLNEIGR